MEVAADQKPRRNIVACIECRKRKRKCDGYQPCSTCKNQSRPCFYHPQTQTRKRKVVDEDYIQALENKILALQSIVDKAGLPESAGDSSDLDLTQIPFAKGQLVDSNDAQNDAPPNLGEDKSNFSPDFEHRETFDAAVGTLSHLMWKISIGEGGEPSFTGPSGNFGLDNLEVEQKQVSPSCTENSLWMYTMHNESIRLHFFHLFRTFVNPYHQFLAASSISTSDLLHPDVGSNSDFLVSAILAAGASYSDEEGASLLAQSYATHAEEIMMSCCRQNPDVKVVQGLAILTWRELTQDREHTAWMYNSLAAGLVVHLGLHVIGLTNLSDQTSTLSLQVSTSRTRTFWTFFLLDRIATTLLGRNCTVPWRRVRVPSFRSTFQDQDLSLEQLVFDHQCRLWNIHDEYMDQIYAFDFIDLSVSARAQLLVRAHEALANFHTQVDDTLRLKNNKLDRCVTVFELSYQTSNMLVHRPFLKEPLASPSFKLAFRSLKTAALRVARILRIFRKSSNFRNAPPFLVHHFLTAAISGNLKICIEALDEMYPRWPKLVKKAIALIRRLASGWAVVWALPLHLSGPIPTDTNISTEIEQSSSLETAFEQLDGVDFDLFDWEDTWNTFDAAKLGDLHDMVDFDWQTGRSDFVNPNWLQQT